MQIEIRDTVQQISGAIADIGSVCTVVAINGSQIRVRYSDGALSAWIPTNWFALSKKNTFAR